MTRGNECLYDFCFGRVFATPNRSSTKNSHFVQIIRVYIAAKNHRKGIPESPRARNIAATIAIRFKHFNSNLQKGSEQQKDSKAISQPHTPRGKPLPKVTSTARDHLRFIPQGPASNYASQPKKETPASHCAIYAVSRISAEKPARHSEKRAARGGNTTAPAQKKARKSSIATAKVAPFTDGRCVTLDLAYSGKRRGAFRRSSLSVGRVCCAHRRGLDASDRLDAIERGIFLRGTIATEESANWGCGRSASIYWRTRQ